MVEIDEADRFENALAELKSMTEKLDKPFDEEQALQGIRDALYGHERVRRQCDSCPSSNNLEQISV
jgi:hypothetical protein